MDYNFLDNAIDRENIVLPASDKINPFLLKNNYTEIIKAVDFLASEDKMLYVHGFLGTGKRQFINYLMQFRNKDVITLEYYCKKSTVCDDILLNFIDEIEKLSLSKVVNINAKITTLAVKFQQYISSIKKPFVIILHSYDDIEDTNLKYVKDFLEKASECSNIKIVVSIRAMLSDVIGNTVSYRKIFLKAFSKEIFKEFLDNNNIKAADMVIEDFYKYTRGYYYYTALSVKIIHAMKVSLSDFLQKFALSEMSFDSYLSMIYVNIIPNAIRNFFWFLCSIRHGISLNALAVYELYDEFSIEYLKSNLMIFQSGENLYVQDYFQQETDFSIPAKTEIRLHKYIIGIYEKELKEQLQSRSILISRQAMRTEIEYHNKRIREIEEGKSETKKPDKQQDTQVNEQKTENKPVQNLSETIDVKLNNAYKLAEEKKITEAIEAYLKITEEQGIDSRTLADVRIALGRLYKEINDLKKAEHYYELAETYYRLNNESINLCYLYYEMTNLYFDMYKYERAIETIKKVIYSVDTPQSLMVDACVRLGNIYFENNEAKNAYEYYQKALASSDENTSAETLAELYFKFGVVEEDKNEEKSAMEYYNKCISLNVESPYKALSYSNLGSCYYDNENYSDAKDCFEKAYKLEKSSNNYEGIYYNSLKLAKIYENENSQEALNYYIEAKQSAEFLNISFYLLEATVALGDFYYNNPKWYKKALSEYFKAKKLTTEIHDSVDINKLDSRINDMKLRMAEEDFNEIAAKYE